MKRQIFILAAIFAFSLASSGFSCNKSATKQIRHSLSDTLKTLTVRVATPKGANVQSFKQPTQQQLEAIDIGFDWEELARAKYNYPNPPRSNYTIFILPAVTTYDSAGNYAPSFAVPINCGNPFGNDVYCGGDYDKGAFHLPNGQIINPGIHYVWAAEQYLNGSIEPCHCRWAIADADNADYIARSVKYGGEHRDIEEFEPDQFAITSGASHQHPIRPVEVSPGRTE